MLCCRSPISIRPVPTTPPRRCIGFIGSIAFTGAPRTAFAVIEDAENADHRLFLHAKNNLAPPPQGLGFRLEQTIVAEGILGSRVVWDTGPVTITANQALAAEADGTESQTAKAEAMEFLKGALASGPMAAIEVMKIAREHALTPKAVRSARESLQVKIQRDGFGPGSKSLWSLPYMPNTSIDAQQSNWASMNPEGIYGGQVPVEGRQDCMAPDLTEGPPPTVPDRTCRQCNGTLDGAPNSHTRSTEAKSGYTRSAESFLKAER